ncbi:MAG: tryptophan synthase alpha chain [Halanaerobium sp. 4-GBenrich]|jgi:tryptophan synthase alpha chain|uniref:Tryptophan synthase alpha chain n=1 Tax=Halanaerobium congolense TaxID=54121 RepID=A0A4R8GVK0_9FIRM|nr:tryptophan synthase subunit alpha [Halanaerobium congolense]KXS49377.1 MAG: tryptophan synthase alpha chain [Halanaerobium sp. T82-1]ODS49948.1 MAG: tryptophan synthase alpha chain [Halanaerobium sp. 4-GBenrich]OEG63464.1 MAG: tryptophan synthase subunit alpha [Halanaerobium sp. MDAL1]PTX16218.1 tryptophan synthase alpha chain [Halanaerobium congolense]TDP25881.1 tryptophan synthase alpha chain [Halanaerobium congolense]
MNKITAQFQNKNALITYISGGDPSLEMTEKLIYKLQNEGVDLIEIGIPFSDPLADGPVIQEASQRALKAGTTLKKLIAKLDKIQNRVEVPLILMGYYNSILNYGEKEFARDISKAGISGVIVPDLPVDERADLFKYLAEFDISQIMLVTPNTSEQRLKKISAKSSGFLYCVAHLGTTGDDQQGIYPELETYLNRVRKTAGELPLGLGFGIDGPEKAKKIIDYSDGIIIGSALIKVIQAGNNEDEMLNNAGQFVKSIKSKL